ncbi:MAG: hypothetical protein HQL84_16825 [Magnetococcales bacterium]|nr:hypothetical protein [Magnetococcales bacterium]MBF0151686.1 hypothetical protein [Magnetococcales bacterium]
MLRIFLLGLLLYLGYRLFSHFLSGAMHNHEDGGSIRKEGGDVLVACEHCKTRVPRQLMVQRGEKLYCSIACADS